MATKKAATKTPSTKAVAGTAAPKKTAAKKAATNKAVPGAVKKTAAKKAAPSTAKKAPSKKPATKKSSGAKADRALVSREAHEVGHVAKKLKVDAKVVTKAIGKVGNKRTAVEAAVLDHKKRSRAADRALVSREPHEIARLAKKFKLPAERVLEVVKRIGPSRKKVEAALAAG
jgi:hypothetical protein